MTQESIVKFRLAFLGLVILSGILYYFIQVRAQIPGVFPYALVGLLPGVPALFPLDRPYSKPIWRVCYATFFALLGMSFLDIEVTWFNYFWGAGGIIALWPLFTSKSDS